jgi:hypothetical protein
MFHYMLELQGIKSSIPKGLREYYSGISECQS